MVIGYNPSHTNVNSEVNAPFKILSTLVRFMKNDEEKLQIGADLGNQGAGFASYKVPRKNVGGAMDSGERLDTMEGNDLYDDEEDDDDCGNAQYRYDASDDEEDREGEDSGQDGKKGKKGNYKHDKIEVNFDDIDDMDDQECLLDYQQ